MRVLIPIQSRELSQASMDALLAISWVPGSQIDLLTFVDTATESEAAASEHMQTIEDLAIDLQNELPHCEISLFVRPQIHEDEILGFAAELNTGLIILDSIFGEQSVGPFGGAFCHRLINNSPCPVVVARNNITKSPVAKQAGISVLVPIDDSVWTDAALKWLGSLSWPLSVRFVLCAVVETATGTAIATGIPRLTDENRKMLEIAQQFLGLRARQLGALTGTNNIAVEVGFGETSDTIVRLSQRVGADLIVMGSRGKSGMKTAIIGSTSQAVLAKAPCTVAVIRGLSEADRGWSKTGAFTKPKNAISHPSTHSRPPQSMRRSGNDRMPHIMPGGIG